MVTNRMVQNSMKNSQKDILKIIFVDRLGFRMLILLCAFFSAVSGLLLPYFQKQFSQNLQVAPLAYCVLFTLLYFGLNQLTLFVGQYESIIAQKKMALLLYERNLQLKPLTIQNRSVGEIVSLYTTDVPSAGVWLEQSLPYSLTIAFPLLLTPVFLHSVYHLSWFFSLGLVLSIVLINSLLAYRQSKFLFRFKFLAAARMGLVNEWIQNIRGLKILNWISGFEKKIIKKRVEETKNRISMVTNGQIMNAISSSINFWMNIAILAYFVWLQDEVLNKSDLIGLLWVTGVFLARPFRQLPWFFTFLFDGWTSFQRLVNFLNLKNQNEVIQRSINVPSEELIHVKNLNLILADHKKLLSNIDLTVGTGEMIAVIGPVGSGKSLLLKSLIRETPFIADEFYCAAASYLPQEHFVMSATLRDNVNFNYGSDVSNDHEILRALKKSQFNFELDRIGDASAHSLSSTNNASALNVTVGERGLNLSGGQKQRVTLARQIYNLKKLIILDDPLSALDINTEASLIQEFVDLKQKGHTLILTTQRFTVLPFCDRVIFIDQGRLTYDGPAAEFLKADKYQSFLKGEFQ